MRSQPTPRRTCGTRWVTSQGDGGRACHPGRALWAGRDFLILLSVPVTQVLQFNTNCPECNAPANTNMKLVRILCMGAWAQIGALCGGLHGGWWGGESRSVCC